MIFKYLTFATFVCEYRTHFNRNPFTTKIHQISNCVSRDISNIIISIRQFVRVPRDKNQDYFAANCNIIEGYTIVRRKFIKILTMMAEDWGECTEDENDVTLREMTLKAKTSDRIMNLVILLHTSAIIAYCIAVCLADVDVTDKTKELPFVNKLEIPININTQRLYKSILISEFVHMIVVGWGAGVTNALLLTMVSNYFQIRPHIHTRAYTCARDICDSSCDWSVYAAIYSLRNDCSLYHLIQSTRPIISYLLLPHAHSHHIPQRATLPPY